MEKTGKRIPATEVSRPTHSINHGGYREGAGRWVRNLITEIVERPLKTPRSSDWSEILKELISVSDNGQALKINARRETVHTRILFAFKRTNRPLHVIHTRKLSDNETIVWLGKERI